MLYLLLQLVVVNSPTILAFLIEANPQWNLPKIILNVSLVKANLPQLVDMSRVGYNELQSLKKSVTFIFHH